MLCDIHFYYKLEGLVDPTKIFSHSLGLKNISHNTLNTCYVAFWFMISGRHWEQVHQSILSLTHKWHQKCHKYVLYLKIWWTESRRNWCKYWTNIGQNLKCHFGTSECDQAHFCLYIKDASRCSFWWWNVWFCSFLP